eukprot:scaffold1354_cov105-Pinguiococcus_pyrenoidosus.AAC.1
MGDRGDPLNSALRAPFVLRASRRFQKMATPSLSSGVPFPRQSHQPSTSGTCSRMKLSSFT